MLKSRLTSLAVLFLCVLPAIYAGNNAQQRLMKINRDQLLKINELLLKKLSPEDLSKLEGKEIKVRAKVINTGESVHYQIEEISGDAKKVLKAKANDEIIVKGCIHKSTLGNKHDFKVDLSYVLPPEKNAAGTETGK